MTTSTLRYELEPKIYGIFSESNASKTQIDDLIISEKFELNSNYESLSDSLGDYKIIIEKEIKDNKALQTTHIEISRFVSELDKAWIYACGHPLTKKDFAFMAPYVDFPDGKLPGWKSNFREVEKEINKGKAHISFSYRTLHNASFSYWPLEVALDVRKKYLHTTEQVQALIDLHYYAHKIKSGHAMLFFLAKSLELIRSLLPGKDTSAKEKQLPSEVREKLFSSFNDVLRLSNTRFEIRHIVKDPKDSTLHPKLTSEEIKIFKNDADLIIRAVVCMKLGVPLRIPARK